MASFSETDNVEIDELEGYIVNEMNKIYAWPGNDLANNVEYKKLYDTLVHPVNKKNILIEYKQKFVEEINTLTETINNSRLQPTMKEKLKSYYDKWIKDLEYAEILNVKLLKPDEKNSQLIRNELNKTEEKINKLVDAPEYGYTYDDNVVKVEDESKWMVPKATWLERWLDTRIDFLGYGTGAKWEDFKKKKKVANEEGYNSIEERDKMSAAQQAAEAEAKEKAALAARSAAGEAERVAEVRAVVARAVARAAVAAAA